MSAITNVWRQLVQRRLWPVAILLIAALAAVPLALAKDPDPAVPGPVVPAADAAASAESALAVQPIVAPATAADRGKRRKVLGAREERVRTAPGRRGRLGCGPELRRLHDGKGSGHPDHGRQ